MAAHELRTVRCFRECQPLFDDAPILPADLVGDPLWLCSWGCGGKGCPATLRPSWLQGADAGAASPLGDDDDRG